MAIKFNCGSCGKRLGVGDHLAGRKGRCPQCGQVFRVPTPESAAPPPPRVMKQDATDYSVRLDDHADASSSDRKIEETEAHKRAYATASEDVDRLAASARAGAAGQSAAPPAKTAPATAAQKWIGLGCLCAIILGIVGMCMRGDKAKDGRGSGGGAGDGMGETTQLVGLTQGQEYLVSGWYGKTSANLGAPPPADSSTFEESARSLGLVSIRQRQQSNLEGPPKCVLRPKAGFSLGGAHLRRVYAVGKYSGNQTLSQGTETMSLPLLVDVRLVRQVRAIDSGSLAGLKEGEVCAMWGSYENRVDNWYVVGHDKFYGSNTSRKFAFQPAADLRGLPPGQFLWVEGTFCGYQQFTTVLGAPIDAPCLDPATVKLDW